MTTLTRCADCGAELRQGDRYCMACDALNPSHRFPKFRPRSADLPRQAGEDSPRRPAMRAFSCPRCEAVVAPGSWLCAGCGLDVAKLLAQPEREALDGVWTTPSPHSTESYRPIGRWTAAWRASLGVTAFLSLALTLLLLGVLVVDGGYRLPVEADLARLGHVARGVMVAFALGVVCVLLIAVGWTNRAYRNLPLLGATGFRIAPDLVAAAWFVPVINMFIPVLALRDVWRASDPKLPYRSDAWHKASVDVPIVESWAMSIIGGIAIAIGWWGLQDVSIWNETVSQSSLAIAALGHLLLAIGLIQLAVVAESVSTRQRSRADRIGPPEALLHLERLRAGGTDDLDDLGLESIEDVVALRSLLDGNSVYGRY